MFDLSKIFIALFTFPSSIYRANNKCCLIFIKYFVVVIILPSLEIVLPSNGSCPICPSFHFGNLLFEVSAFSFDFVLKEVFLKQ